MAAERDLRRLIAGLHPELHPGRYVYTVVPGDLAPGALAPGAPRNPPGSPALNGLRPVVTVAEDEGLTVVVPQEQADAAGLPYDYVAAWITLRVRSALDAVGLTAAVARALADAGLSCNVVAGYHHDHVFVPYTDAGRALRTLHDLSAAPG